MPGVTGGNGRQPAGDPPDAVGTTSRAAHDERAVHRQLMRFGDAETLATPVWERRGCTVRDIDAELARLWDVSGGTGDEPGTDGPSVPEKGVAHARASVLNLIVTAPDEGAANRVVATMMRLGIRHPSRVIVLVADPNAKGDPIDARISVHCHPSPHQGGRVCYEQVVLTLRDGAAQHLSSVVTPLLIHDLPTHVWWPGDPPFADPIFAQLADIADRLIIDSSDFSDLLTGYRRLAAMRRRSGVGDLAWERLAWWHEITAEFFDTPRFRRYLPNLSRLWIRYAVPSQGEPGTRHGDEVAPEVASPMTQAMLYAGWLASRLDWRRHRTREPLSAGRLRLVLEGRYEMIDLRIEPVETDAVDTGELTAVSLRSFGEAGMAEFLIDRRPDEATVATNADGMTAFLRTVSFDVRGEAELLSQQLVIDRRDPIFEAALRAAAIFLDAAHSPAETAA